MTFASFKNACVVRSSWLEEGGRRLDCNPYMSGALEARDALKRLSVTEKLTDVTERIFHAGREGRIWVEDPKYGVPFMGSSDIRVADFSALPLIAKKQVARNPLFTLGEGWTLITRSGTIGRMAYARPDMAGMACSEHVLRVVPDSQRIPPGYLYAFLSSRYGVPLVVSGTYGAIIQHIEPEHIAALPVPRFDPSTETAIAAKVDAAARARAQAVELLREAANRLHSRLGLKQATPVASLPKPDVVSVPSESFRDRGDAYFYGARNAESRKAFDGVAKNRPLGEVAEVFIPGIFKRLYASDPQFGSPYITGGDVFELAPTSEKYLMRRVAAEYRLLLKQGMVVVQEAGQLGGLIGRSVMVGSYLDGFSCSNNMIRIVPEDDIDGGYLFTLLSSEHGVRLLSREAAGSSIPHTDEQRVKRIRVPWPSRSDREEIGAPAIRARELRDQACIWEREARDLLEAKILGGV
ncbi:type I restriction enzyme, S subunit [Cupriavidus sp. OV038]|uniref:methylation-associated defense system restriction endonuclease subunit S MAD5 n=1 Tax=unclassified Cupriavidus TaxID=2640874 RepID=UPI0008ED2CDC|nr:MULTISPECIES: restriction endonuclease subunit S [unclassified Cupriavidus]SFD19142.1 type I restriction enzyme, S subunit [Cupriavidus sp. OV038]SFP87538.1 type I restriction enzyme, S subunit [Cupriavidus sp. OV096]